MNSKNNQFTSTYKPYSWWTIFLVVFLHYLLTSFLVKPLHALAVSAIFFIHVLYIKYEEEKKTKWMGDYLVEIRDKVELLSTRDQLKEVKETQLIEN